MRLALANPPPASCPADPAVEAYARARLDELARLRGLALDRAERIGLAFDGKLGPAEAAELAGKDGLLSRFFRSERAVRQIVILEIGAAGPCARRRIATGCARRTKRRGEARESEPGAPDSDGARAAITITAPMTRWSRGCGGSCGRRRRRTIRSPRRRRGRRSGSHRGGLLRRRAKPVSVKAALRGCRRKSGRSFMGRWVTLRMALLARADVLPIPVQGLKARYLPEKSGGGAGRRAKNSARARCFGVMFWFGGSERVGLRPGDGRRADRHVCCLRVKGAGAGDERPTPLAPRAHPYNLRPCFPF